MRTPEGAMFAAQQGQLAQQQQQSMQLAQQWSPLNDPTTGRPVALVNGKGQTVSLPRMDEDEQLTFVDTQKPDPLGIGIVTVREPRVYNRKTGKMREVPMEDGEAVAAAGGGSAAPAAKKETGGARSESAPGAGKVAPASGFLKAVGK
jgi:hypothetical protein